LGEKQKKHLKIPLQTDLKTKKAYETDFLYKISCETEIMGKISITKTIKNVFYTPLHDISSQKVAPHDISPIFSVQTDFLGEKSAQIQKFYLILFKFISLL